MEVEASRKTVLMVMAVLMFSTFVAEMNAKDASECVKECANLCAGTANPIFCYAICARKCGGSVGVVPPELGHCELGCLTSTCFNQRLDAKKGKAYEEKAEACVDSCSESCQKSYVPH